MQIQKNDIGERLDKVLAAHYKDFSRSYFQKLISRGLVVVNGNPVKKRVLVQSDDEIEIEFALTEEISLEPENIPLNILFEDNDFLAIDKPAGMVVHPAHGHRSHTFVNALLYHCQSLPNKESLRPGIVHRLDKETSGVLIAAKTEKAHEKLVQSFASREIKKTYLAICVGSPKEGFIDAPIGRHPKRRKEMTVVEGGKEAATKIQVLEKQGYLSVVLLSPETGRTHQLRVHLRHLNAPVLGDKVYGSQTQNTKYKAHRHYLHALSVELAHPISGQPIKIQAPVPTDMQQALKHFL